MQEITVQGLVATVPRHIVTQDNIPLTSLRLAAQLKDGRCNWYTVNATGQLALNIAASINKGERIIVVGPLYVRDWDNGERAGTSVEIEARTIGHDLTYGTSDFYRTVLVAETKEEVNA